MKRILTILGLLVGLNAYNQVYIPNSFTPNNDGYNDYITTYTQDTLVVFDFKIYNIYGDLVHHATEIGNVWMGGQYYYAPTGLYTYTVV